MATASCAECLHYEIIGGGYGFCRYNPAVPLGSERIYAGRAGITGVWPVVCDVDYCGQYENRPWTNDSEMDAPPPEPDPPDGGVLSTPAEHTAHERYRDPLGDPPQRR